MFEYRKKYRFWQTIFFVSALVLALSVALLYATQSASSLFAVGYVAGITGVLISVIPYVYYRTRRDEKKRQEQYDAEMLGVVGQQQLDESEEQENRN